jgi:hypothetical protein
LFSDVVSSGDVLARGTLGHHVFAVSPGFLLPRWQQCAALLPSWHLLQYSQVVCVHAVPRGQIQHRGQRDSRHGVHGLRRACTVQPARFLKLCELHQLCLGLHLGHLWAHPAGSARVQLSVDDPVAGCTRGRGQPLLPTVHTHQCEQLQCCLSCVYRHTCQQLERPLGQHKAGESVDARVVACACPGTCLRCSHDGALVATCQLDGGGHASPHICLADDGHLPGRVRPAVHSLGAWSLLCPLHSQHRWCSPTWLQVAHRRRGPFFRAGHGSTGPRPPIWHAIPLDAQFSHPVIQSRSSSGMATTLFLHNRNPMQPHILWPCSSCQCCCCSMQ